MIAFNLNLIGKDGKYIIEDIDWVNSKEYISKDYISKDIIFKYLSFKRLTIMINFASLFGSFSRGGNSAINELIDKPDTSLDQLLDIESFPN